MSNPSFDGTSGTFTHVMDGLQPKIEFTAFQACYSSCYSVLDHTILDPKDSQGVAQTGMLAWQLSDVVGTTTKRILLPSS